MKSMQKELEKAGLKASNAVREFGEALKRLKYKQKKPKSEYHG